MSGSQFLKIRERHQHKLSCGALMFTGMAVVDQKESLMVFSAPFPWYLLDIAHFKTMCVRRRGSETDWGWSCWSVSVCVPMWGWPLLSVTSTAAAPCSDRSIDENAKWRHKKSHNIKSTTINLKATAFNKNVEFSIFRSWRISKLAKKIWRVFFWSFFNARNFYERTACSKSTGLGCR